MISRKDDNIICLKHFESSCSVEGDQFLIFVVVFLIIRNNPAKRIVKNINKLRKKIHRHNGFVICLKTILGT